MKQVVAQNTKPNSLILEPPDKSSLPTNCNFGCLTMKTDEMEVPMTPNSNLRLCMLQRSASLGCVPMVPSLGEFSLSASERRTHKIRELSPQGHSSAASPHSHTPSYLDIEPPQTPVSASPHKRRFLPQTPLSYFSPQHRCPTSSSELPEPQPSPSLRNFFHRSASSSLVETPQSIKSTISRKLVAPLAPLLQMSSPLVSPMHPRRGSSKSSFPPAEISFTEIDSVASDEADLVSELALPAKLSMEDAQGLVHKLQDICDQQDKREVQIQDEIEHEKDVAKARFQRGSETGAVLAMKKILRLQQERTRVTVASDVASDALLEVRRAMQQAGSLALGNKVDIGEDNAYVLQEVQEILAGRDPVSNDRSELLKQVQRLL